MYAGKSNNWCYMKKFSEYMLKKQSFEVIKNGDDNDFDDDQILMMFGKLDLEDKKIIKNQLVEIFRELLGNRKKFTAAVEFIMNNLPKNDEQEAQDMFSMVKRFFENPIEKGLGYVSGQNNIVNSANPNINGATSNGY